MTRPFYVLACVAIAMSCASVGNAIESLKLQLPDGGPPLPQPTSAFVAFCKTDPHNCQQYIILDSLKAMMMFMDSPAFCLPDSALMTDKLADQQIQKIKTWLADHKELGKQETSISITSAYLAIYPNPSRKPCPLVVRPR